MISASCKSNVLDGKPYITLVVVLPVINLKAKPESSFESAVYIPD